MKKDGCVLVGTKTFYYGLGGGYFELEKYLKQRYTHEGIVPQIIERFNDMKSIERVILELKWGMCN